jgi:peptide/nickel transport system permease protein
LAALAVSADFVAPRDPLVQDVASRLEPPGPEFWFGSDNFGRDVFSRVIHGARSSLYIAVASVFMGAVVGTLAGTAAVYRGGRLDLGFQRLADTLLGFPFLVLALIMIVALGASTQTVTGAIAVSLMPQVARLARSRALAVKEETYVLAARAIGAPPRRIVFKHILPHLVGPVLAYATGYVGVALVAESALSFLGLGVPPPYPSWGAILQDGRRFMEVAPWIAVFPGVFLSVTVLSIAVLGDALRDVLDPRAPARSALWASRASR